jgi:hypothetical protein
VTDANGLRAVLRAHGFDVEGWLERGAKWDMRHAPFDPERAHAPDRQRAHGSLRACGVRNPNHSRGGTFVLVDQNTESVTATDCAARSGPVGRWSKRRPQPEGTVRARGVVMIRVCAQRLATQHTDLVPERQQFDGLHPR